ncbi:TPA: hypothetical protein LA742_001228 [Clostridium botulinum]|uniref:hypothetical protein n=1 Tax=Clostridium sporogenes TaxID=1509 RepID=UPI000A50639E|nr:hypothetical protein [Clostridium sporogenes]HBJ2612795.1 hypothetical protein [Clostridium botulinum]
MEIVVQVKGTKTYLVDAYSLEEAIEKIKQGYCENVEDDLEFIEGTFEKLRYN